MGDRRWGRADAVHPTAPGVFSPKAIRTVAWDNVPGHGTPRPPTQPPIAARRHRRRAAMGGRGRGFSPSRAAGE